MDSTVSNLPAAVVIAECPNKKFVSTWYGSVRQYVAVPFDLAYRRPDGAWMVMLTVHDFDDGKGPGCPACAGTGQIGVYQRRDIDPYVRMYPCPHCYKPD